MKIGAYSHRGKRKTDNHDSFHFDREEGFFILADGVDSNYGGKESSAAAISSAIEFFQENKRQYGDVQSLLLETAYAVHRRLEEKSRQQKKDMAATLLLALYEKGKLHYCWGGNIRLYHLSNRDFTRLTRDHTLFENRKVGNNYIPEGDSNGDERYALTNVAGKKGFKVEVGSPYQIQKGERLLFCTDGLFKELSEEEIAEILSDESLNPTQLSEMLARKSNEKGGCDNITSIVCELGQSDFARSKIVPFPQKEREKNNKRNSSEVTLEEDVKLNHFLIGVRELVFAALIILTLLWVILKFFKLKRDSPWRDYL